ncbi:MAG: leucine-rich repeat protein, partial [Paludibacter sp.]
FYEQGTTGTIDISANVNWTVTTDQSWLSVSPDSGSGDRKLTLIVDKNDSTTRRTAKVTVSSPGFGSQVITVTQTGFPKTINITAGGLSTGLTAVELSTTADLIITGTMDARDFKTMRDLMPELARLDLSGASIAAFSGTGGTYDFSTGYSSNAIPPSAFYVYSQNRAKTSLISIKIPSTVSYIGSSAFQSCTGLTSVYINSVYPIDFTNSGDPFYNSNKAGCTLYVPYATKPYYFAATGWKDFMNIVEGAQGFLVGQRTVKFPSTTTSKSILITVKANVAWQAQSNQPWLVVSSNDSILKLTAEANPSDTIRKATVIVTSPGFDSQTVDITQAAAPRNVTAGGLSTILTATELNTLTEIALIGTIDARDFKTMRENMPALANIDLAGVNVVAYEGPNCDPWGGTGIKKYPVNEIPYQAFYMSKKIKSIIMPQTVTSVGEYAFGSTSLSSVIFSKSLKSIGIYAFSVCTDLNSISLPDSLVTIGEYAFNGCTNLSGTLQLPSSLKAIRALAFLNCSNMSGNLIIPSSVDSIGGSAFNYCYGLSSLVINSVDPIIGPNAFSSCSGLKSITLPTTLTTIGEGAFGYCVNLKTISLPPSLKLIGSKAFQVCMGITSIDFPASLTTIGEYAFTNSGLINLTIPSTLTNIGAYAFSHCTNLNSVSFPSTLKKISDGLFTSCTSLYPIMLPSGLEIIGKDAFNSCTALTNINLPDSLTTIGDYAFQYCTGLTNISLPNKLVSIGSCSFLSCTGLIGIVIPNSVTSIGSSAFSNCTGLKSITFGSSLTGISDYVFNSCSNLTNITLPNTIKSIGADAFKSCTGLITITIPNSVTSIGSEAFTYCSSLNNVIIPNSITSIQSGTFSNCTGMKSITIPNSVQTIGYSAFSHCTSLNNLTIPNSVTYITDAAFEYCSSLTSVIIPNLITMLKYNTFSHCTKLSNVTIPNSVKSTEASVFENCSSLTNIILPGSLTNIGHYFFSYCTALTSIIIPNSVTIINTGAFEYCSSLKNVTIGNSVKTIEDGVFKNCNSLSSISIPTSVTSLGSATFSCSGLNSIYVYSKTPIPIYSWISVFDNVNKSICVLYVPVGSKALYKSAYLWQDFVNIIEMPTAVPTINAEKISIYLDPVSGSFSIHGIEGIYTISIYDMNGRAMLCKQVQSNENISISNFPTGMYIIRIITKIGTIEQKVLKN